MTHTELECAVARATGETRSTIRQRGFSVVPTPQLAPQIVDWDALDAERYAFFPDRRRQESRQQHQ